MKQLLTLLLLLAYTPLLAQTLYASTNPISITSDS